MHHVMLQRIPVIGCYGYKRRETHGVATILPWPQPYWEPFGASTSKRSEGGRQFASKPQLWGAILTLCEEIQAETLQKLTSSMDSRTVKVISKKGAYVNITCSVKMFLIEIAFDFSKYDLLMLQIQQMKMFSSLQPIKCFETVVNNNLEQCILGFSFLKKILLEYQLEVCSIKFELYPYGWWLENYTDCHFHRQFSKIRQRYHLHNHLECGVVGVPETRPLPNPPPNPSLIPGDNTTSMPSVTMHPCFHSNRKS